MPQQRNAQKSYNEGTMHLALLAIQRNDIESGRRAAAVYDIPQSTLQARHAGRPSRRDCEPNSKRLKKQEEDAIITYILDLDTRGIGATRDMVRDMASDLLAARGEQPVGKCWVTNFSKRTPEIKLRRSRPYDRQRALNEDPRIISPWFSLVQSVKEKYGIMDEDTYNFDETGFLMGKIRAQMVFTGSEKRGAPKRVQPGNREWVSVIQGISAAGWAIPPFVIFAGKVLISSWYNDLPRDWVLEVSPNGWTSNELAIAWLKHFNAHTKARSVGSHRLLIVDGHGSHQSFEFHQFCKEEKIIVLCMPSHSSHLLQPLDVVCFSLLKRAYGDEISALARYSTKHIKKEAFLPAFKRSFDQAFSKKSICSSFQAAGLVPHNPEAVLSKLDVVLRTPTPPALQDTPWEAKTPGNAHEIEAQSTLIRNRIQRHKSSSPASILELLYQLQKGAEQAANKVVLIAKENAELRKVAEAATERKSRKRKYIRTEDTLTVGDVLDLIAPEDVGGGEGGEKRAKRARGERHCRRCGETGHNARTCKVEI